METKFKRGAVTYSLLSTPKGRREWDVRLEDILPEPPRDDYTRHRKPARRVEVKAPKRKVRTKERS